MQLKLLLLLIPFLLLASTDDRALYIKKYGNESKTALVIGNANYDGNTLSKLKNSLNHSRPPSTSYSSSTRLVKNIYTTSPKQL
jgi:hypothetical protein